MKKLPLFLILFFIIVNVYSIEQSSLAVSKFAVIADAVTEEQAEQITNQFVKELQSIQNILVQRSVYELELKAQNFASADFKNKERTSLLGQKVGVDYLISGRIGKAGKNLYIEIDVILAKTATIIHNDRILRSSYDELLPEVSSFTTKLSDSLFKNVKVGSIGQGGGIIFFISPDGSYFEATEVLAHVSWSEAEYIAHTYTNRGFNDWRLPTKSELDIVYLNLKKANIVDNAKPVWTSEAKSDLHAWQQRFSDGYQGINYKSSPNDVIAIRAFTP